MSGSGMLVPTDWQQGKAERLGEHGFHLCHFDWHHLATHHRPD
jgi:hypothetical protein